MSDRTTNPRRLAFPVLVFLMLHRGLLAVDCNTNGVKDAVDIAAGTSEDCNANEVPDECDVASFRIGYAEPREFPTSIDSSEFPGSAVRGDFDGDDDIDLVVRHGSDVDWSSDETRAVTLLRNAGDGTFGPPELVTSGFGRGAMVSADLEGDGDLDLVIAFPDHREKVVRTFVNLGDGTFEDGSAFLRGRQVGQLAAADFDDDGDPDIAATDSTHLLVLVNQEGIDFSLSMYEHEFGVETFPDRVPTLATDIDTDGYVDLLVPNAVTRSYWLFRNDRGVIQHPEVLHRPTPSTRLIPGDLDGDGDIDLVSGGNVLFNDGRAVFEPPVGLNVGGSARSVEDLDRDGDLDLLMSTGHTALLLLNDGSGSFSRPVELPLRDSPAWMGAPDLDGDGDNDLLVVFDSRNEVSVSLQLDVGVPEHPDVNDNGIPDACEPDCNRNGVPDSMDVANGTSSDCNGNGSPDECDVVTAVDFASPVAYLERESVGDIEGADFDADGDLDLAVGVRGDRTVTVTRGNRTTQFRPGTILILENDGNGAFRGGDEFDLGDVDPGAPVAAHLDEDDTMDLAIISRPTEEILVLRGASPGEEVASFPVGPNAQAPLAVDIDLDGDLDLLTGNSRDGSVYLLENRGNAAFDPVRSLEGIGSGVIAADVNGDRADDLVAEIGGTIYLHLNDRAGEFPARQAVGPGRVLVAADFDGDGDIDLVGEGSHRDDRQLLRNDGTGMFAAEPLPNRPVWHYPSAADLDRDGDIDLVSAGTVVRNDGPERGWSVHTLTESPGGSYIVVGDWDGDGRTDLVMDSSDRGLSVLLNETLPAPSLDEDRDGVPDECAPVAFGFLRGDCTTDGTINLTDPICVLARLFAGGEVACLSSLDTNADLEVNLTDAVFLLGFLFGGGPAPVEPFPDCATGRERDQRLGCTVPPDCQ